MELGAQPTDHDASNDVASTEAITNFDPVFFGGAYILSANDTRKFFACRQRDSVDDGD